MFGYGLKINTDTLRRKIIDDCNVKKHPEGKGSMKDSANQCALNQIKGIFNLSFLNPEQKTLADLLDANHFDDLISSIQRFAGLQSKDPDDEGSIRKEIDKLMAANFDILMEKFERASAKEEEEYEREYEREKLKK